LVSPVCPPDPRAPKRTTATCLPAHCARRLFGELATLSREVRQLSRTAALGGRASSDALSWHSGAQPYRRAAANGDPIAIVDGSGSAAVGAGVPNDVYARGDVVGGDDAYNR